MDIYGPKVVFCGGDAAANSLSEGTLQVAIPPSPPRWDGLDDDAVKQIADEFQPQLLFYRLKNLAKLRDYAPEGGGGEFTAATRQLAFTVGACLREDPKLARDTIQLLRSQDEEVRAQQLSEIACVVTEVLWGFAHHGALRAVAVDELAKMANALLRTRGMELVYSAEEVGWKLRALGIPRHSTAGGREVLLDRANRQRIHALARTYDLSCAEHVAGCAECRGLEGVVSTGLMKV